MAGTINLALTQQFDAQGDPLSGGLLQPSPLARRRRNRRFRTSG